MWGRCPSATTTGWWAYTGATPVFPVVRCPVDGEKRTATQSVRACYKRRVAHDTFVCLDPTVNPPAAPLTPAPPSAMAQRPTSPLRLRPLASATGCAGVRSRLLAGLATGREL